MLATAMRYSHTLLKEILVEGDWAIDATMGNGNDTLLLAELVGASGKVFGFDIQEAAVKNTQTKLTQAALQQRAELFLQGHETIDTVLPEDAPIKACIFNLGYLPKSDKKIITLPHTTKYALEAAKKRLVPKGRIIIVAYYGHPGGQRELETIQEYCQNLPQEEFNVLSYQFINQKNSPPILFCIEKK